MNGHWTISEVDVQQALDFLRDSSTAMGAARAELVEANAMIDHIEALMIVASEQSSDAKRKAEARASDRYLAAIQRHAKAAAEMERLKSLREAANQRIDAWQTWSANQRSTRIM